MSAVEASSEFLYSSPMNLPSLSRWALCYGAFMLSMGVIG
jgi:hypothetical protein